MNCYMIFASKILHKSIFQNMSFGFYHPTLMDLVLHLQAPLLVGCDIRNMTAETFEIISNQEVIAVNQGKVIYYCSLSFL